MNANRQDKFESNTLKMILLEKMNKFNAFDCARKYAFIFDEHIDYHEFSSLLDQWNTQEIVKVVGYNNDGMCIYALR